jgi:hypothetical protein
MGNSKKGVRPRPKNQPAKLLLSGDNTAVAIGGGQGGQVADRTLNIKLIQLDLGVAAQIKVGDFVQLYWRDSRYEVYFDGQHLGNVPGSYNSMLLPQTEYPGQLVKVAIYGDPLVVVQVKVTANHQ